MVAIYKNTVASLALKFVQSRSVTKGNSYKLTQTHVYYNLQIQCFLSETVYLVM